MFTALCILLSIAGLALLFHGGRRFLRDRRQAAAAGGWVKGEAEIVSASLDIKESMSADRERLTIFRPLVRYRYAASGGEHIGARVWLNRETFGDEDAARRWLAAHRAGGRVAVHYDPAQPDVAALVIDRPSAVVAIVTAGLGALLTWTGLSLLMEA
mgnify:CR=1 FL=1